MMNYWHIIHIYNIISQFHFDRLFNVVHSACFFDFMICSLGQKAQENDECRMFFLCSNEKIFVNADFFLCITLQYNIGDCLSMFSY